MGETCYLCGAPLGAEGCPAYHWHDKVHLRNWARMNPEAPWRRLFHTPEEVRNAKPVGFLIEGFLQRDGATGLVSLVAERKSIAALNISHALLTGEPLFGRFAVTHPPERVIYLCPEVGLSSFKERLEKIGLLPFVDSGKLLVRTLSAEGRLELDDPDFLECVPGSVIVLDTAVRFMKGGDTDPEVVKQFVDSVLNLTRHAEAVLVIHHAVKSADGPMTLESMVRGGGDLGAFLCCCWGTRMHTHGDYESLSNFQNLKPRDFDTPEFTVDCDRETLRMRVRDNVVPLPTGRFKANADGKDEAAVAFIRTHPDMSLRDIAEALKRMGITRSKSWVSDRRYDAMQEQAQAREAG
jgi:AAA domain